ncbi:MAG: hypothetical protein KAT77_00070 [Nanoarchaeota archaeon]|nr:hypothetical protein [Nanoarchaeota archaeon]
MYSIIDGHVHGRDWKQAHKETLVNLFKLAEMINVVYVGLMPNTDEPLINEKNVLYYVSLAPQDSSVKFGINMGITNNTELFKRNIEFAYQNPFVEAFKFYMGESVGNLAVTDYDDQEKAFKIAHQKQLAIPFMTHNEDQPCLEKNKHKWNPKKPWTWNDARPGKSEILSVKRALQLYEAYPFPGPLYLCHLSCPESVQLAYQYKEKGLNIVTATTPTYFLLDTEMLKFLPNDNNPLLYKVNPPVRSPLDRIGMLQCLIHGMIDVIETDYAPHKLEEKLGDNPLSGLRSFPAWPRVIHWLKNELGLSEEKIRDLTFNNPKKIFNLNVEGKEVKGLEKISLKLVKEFDPFAGIL